jgi:hypothetical protein
MQAGNHGSVEPRKQLNCLVQGLNQGQDCVDAILAQDGQVAASAESAALAPQYNDSYLRIGRDRSAGLQKGARRSQVERVHGLGAIETQVGDAVRARQNDWVRVNRIQDASPQDRTQ